MLLIVLSFALKVVTVGEEIVDEAISNVTQVLIEEEVWIEDYIMDYKFRREANTCSVISLDPSSSITYPIRTKRNIKESDCQKLCKSLVNCPYFQFVPAARLKVGNCFYLDKWGQGMKVQGTVDKS